MKRNHESIALVRQVIELLKSPEIVESSLPGGITAFIAIADNDEDKNMLFTTFAETARLVLYHQHYYSITGKNEDMARLLWVILHVPEDTEEYNCTYLQAMYGCQYLGNILSNVQNDMAQTRSGYEALQMAFIGLLTTLRLPTNTEDIEKAIRWTALRNIIDKTGPVHFLTPKDPGWSDKRSAADAVIVMAKQDTAQPSTPLIVHQSKIRSLNPGTCYKFRALYPGTLEILEPSSPDDKPKD